MLGEIMKQKFLLMVSFLALSAITESGDIFKALEINDKKIMRAWFKQSDDCMNVVNQDGQTPLIVAVKKNKRSLVKKLLKRGAFVNQKDNSSQTAMDYAVLAGNKKLITLLLKKDAAVTTDQNVDYLKNFLSKRVRRFGIVSGIFGAFAGINALQSIGSGKVTTGTFINGNSIISGATFAKNRVLKKQIESLRKI